MDKTGIWTITIVGFCLVMVVLVLKEPKPESNHLQQLWRMKDPNRPYKGYFDSTRKVFVTCNGMFLDMTEDKIEREFGSCKK